MNNFDYKKYSLENLEKWIEDAINSSEASPQEIYDVIKNVVRDNYYCYKNHTARCYQLLELLNGSGKGYLSCDKDDKSPECQKAWNDFWEENYYPEEHEVEDIMPPWGHSDMEALRYSEEELNAMCEKAASDQEKEKCREYNLREAEYYNKRAQLDVEYEAIKAAGGYEWTPEPPKDKVVKWQLPVQQNEEDYFVEFPNDLLEAANLKEGDAVEWVDNGDGSYLLKKV